MAQNRLSDELKKYGYVFSVKRTIIAFLITLAIVLLFGCFFSLNIKNLIILTLYTFLMLPFFVKNSYKNRYEQKRFSDINIYMEQFLYSFQKSGKIIDSLQDLIEIFEEGDMKRLLEQCRDHILNTYNEMDVESNALKLIENAYPYPGLITIHKFAIQVEKDGGEYEGSIRLLLESRRMWSDRIYSLLKEKKKQRLEIILSILTSLLLCSMIYYMSKEMNLDVGGQPISQVCTLLVLMLDILIYYLADKKMSGDYLAEDKESEDEIAAQYLRIRTYDDHKLLDRLGKKAAIKNVQRAIEEEFPNWLLNVSLLLQSENVYMALVKSYEDAPKVLKEPIKELIYDIKTNPSGIEPYVNFLSEFTLPEVKSSMKMLYSLSEGKGGDAANQIEDIVRRNQLLLDQSYKMKNEDAVAGMYLLFLAPQLTGGVKLMIDMVLFFAYYMSSM